MTKNVWSIASRTDARKRTTTSLLFVFALASLSVAVQASPDRWRREGWTRTDFSKRSIDWSEIISGGPPKDGIPSIDDPQFAAAKDDKLIPSSEPVIGLMINGDARAYPLRVLIWHEIANDTVAGIPVAVTYCPLCNAAIVFDRRIEGQTLTFGASGKLRRSDLVMYDRQTESWWQQFTGDAIVGALSGTKLKMIASRLESFALFKERNPDGKVLLPVSSAQRAYGRNPYEGYDTSATPFLYRGEYPDGINPMARVVAVRDETNATAVSLELLRAHGHIHSGDYLLSWRPGQASALDRQTLAGGRDVGNVIVQKVVVGRLEDMPYDVTFAFVFHAFHPDVEIIQMCRTANDDRHVPEHGAGQRPQSLRCGPMGSE